MKTNQFDHTNIADLEALIRHHQRLYYDLSEPEISDAEFDILWNRLKTIDPSSPVLNERSQYDADYQHIFPMGSLDKCKSIEEIVRRLGGKSKDNKGLITAKVDGASLTVHYDNGRFVRAVTRGRTETGKGKIATANALAIKSIPKTIPEKGFIEVRGECVILNKDFETMADRFANPRNAASGGLNHQDPRETTNRLITFVACKVIKHFPSGVIWDDQPLPTLEKWGFLVPKSVEVDLSDINALRTAIEQWLASRHEIPYWNDGIVIRILDLHAYKALGFSGVCPNGAMAYKFENEEAETTLRNIVWEAGRIGFVSPVGIFDPVEIGGTTTIRCTLNNPSWMVSHGNPSIGAKIVIAKMNDIIPGLSRVLVPGTGVTNQPTDCPSCGSALAFAETIDGDGAKLKCSNMACPAKLTGNVLNLLTKLEIKGMGDTTIQTLVDSGLVKYPWQVFDLTQEALVKVGFGKGESANIIASIQNIEAKPTHLLACIGLEGWGRRMFEALKKSPVFTDDCLLAGDFQYDQLIKVEAIGPTRARTLANAFSEGGYGRTFLTELLKRVKPVKPVDGIGGAATGTGGQLAGKTFLITGTLSKSRKLIEADIVAAGGQIASGVSKTLSYLVVGTDAGSKLDKAQKLGVKIISEDELNALILL